VPSETEYASRQQKTTTARKAPAAKAPKAIASKKHTSRAKASQPPVAPNSELALVPSVDEPMAEPSRAANHPSIPLAASEAPPPPSRTLAAGQAPITPPQAALPLQAAQQETLPGSSPSSGFSHDPLSFHPQPQIVVPTQDLTWATPYAGPPRNFKSSPIEEAISPTAGCAQQNLGPKPPVFSSNGYIPFGPVAFAPMPSANLKQVDPDVMGEAGSGQKNTQATD
jgi:hypothetical protein